MFSEASIALQERIEDLVQYRFFYQLQPSNIMTWLKNFESKEWDSALCLLERFDYYRESDISSILSNGIEQIRNDFQGNGTIKLHFCPIGKAGKSGHFILYYISNLLKYRDFKDITYAIYDNGSSINIDKLSETDIIVFIDDILGSGGTFLDYINEVEIPSKFSKAILSVVYTSKAKRKILHSHPELRFYGEIKDSAFDDEHPLFGSWRRTKELREFSYKYGIALDKKCPLGYGNSQLLIGFSHSIPNNTLPIIWKETANWHSLIPRSHFVKKKRALDDRQDNNRWLNGLRKLFSYSEDNIRNLYSTENYSLLYVLRGLHQGKILPIIANEIGVANFEIEKIFKMGITKGLWDKDGNLTESSSREISLLLKRISFSNPKPLQFIAKENDDIYIPEIFRGHS